VKQYSTLNLELFREKIMECRDAGFSSIPIFQYSNIPVFQYSNIPIKPDIILKI